MTTMNQSADKKTAHPSPSATVMLLHYHNDRLEVLLVQRNSRTKTNAGAWVFPGGHIDQEDYHGSDDDFFAAQHAAVRETKEETGLIISTDDLHWFAHWTTPVEAPRRYATWFFVAAITDNADIKVDGEEIVDFMWCTPERALKLHRDNEIEITPPTFVSLKELSVFQLIEEALHYFAQQPAQTFNPRPIISDAARVILYEQDAGYEQRQIDCEGARHRLIMTTECWEYYRDF